VKRACQGDPESQDLLFQTLRPCLLCRAEQVCSDPTLAQDICQEVCLQEKSLGSQVCPLNHANQFMKVNGFICRLCGM
jgi:hypothetical protein